MSRNGEMSEKYTGESFKCIALEKTFPLVQSCCFPPVFLSFPLLSAMFFTPLVVQLLPSSFPLSLLLLSLSAKLRAYTSTSS